MERKCKWTGYNEREKKNRMLPWNRESDWLWWARKDTWTGFSVAEMISGPQKVGQRKRLVIVEQRW